MAKELFEEALLEVAFFDAKDILTQSNALGEEEPLDGTVTDL